MNWTCLVYGGPMLFAIIWWVVDAHKWFKGPKVEYILSSHQPAPPISDATCKPRLLTVSPLQVNIEHQMLGRESNVVHGKEANDSGDSSSGSMRDNLDDKKAANLA